MVVTVCHGVFGALGYVDVFVSGGLGVVEWTQHCVGDKEVLVSVYEEHWLGAFTDLAQLVCFGEGPPVSHLAEP